MTEIALAKKEHNHDAADIDSGILDNARLNAASTSGAGIVQLNNATNSTSTEQAATANAVKTAYDLADGKAAVDDFTAILPVSGWSGSAPYTQTVTVSGITAAMEPFTDVGPLSSTDSTAIGQLEAWGFVGRIVTGANNITVTCFENRPEVDIPIRIKVVA